MALTPFDMEGVNRDLLAAGNPAKPDMQSILRRNARDLVLGNAILVSSADAKELEFGVHMAYSDADGGFDTDPSEDVWFEASSLPIPNERPDLPPDNALRIRVTDVLTEYGFTDIDVKAPDRTPEGIWIGFEAMQPVRLDVTSAQGGRSVSFTLTAAEANDWRSGRLDAHGLSRMAVERVLARPGDTVTLAYGDSLFRPAVMCDGSGRLPEHRVKAGIGTFVIGRESEAVMPEILRIDRTVDPRDPLVIEKAFGKENDMENGNVPEYWKGLMDEADLPLAGIVREHGGGLMDFHRMKGIERLTGSSDWDFYSWTVENYDDDLLDVCERENAAAVLAVGTCAAYGGIPAGKGNETGAMGVSAFLKKEGIPAPVINIPGCPPHPDWMVGTLALLLDAMKRKGTEGGVLEIMRGLDDVGRPKVFYPNTHLTCPYLSFFEDGIFSPFMTDKKGCRFELGCRGPWSGCDSATRKWNGGVNWCIANATCVGCTSPNFPDGMSPFYEN